MAIRLRRFETGGGIAAKIEHPQFECKLEDLVPIFLVQQKFYGISGIFIRALADVYDGKPKFFYGEISHDCIYEGEIHLALDALLQDSVRFVVCQIIRKVCGVVLIERKEIADAV